MLKRSIQVRPGLGAAQLVVQEGGRPLRHVFIEWPSVILVRAGCKRVRLDGHQITVREGEVLAVAPGREIEVTNELPASGPYEACCLSFEPQLCAELEDAEPSGRHIPAVLPLGRPPGYLSAAVGRALEACDETEGPPVPIARHHLQEVLLALRTLGWRFDVRGMNRASVRVRRLISSDPAHGWKAAAVARSLGMSEATLRRRLDREGVNFRRVLQQVRMGRALVLLQSSELPVVQIAYESGYNSVSQFTTRFRRHYGQSPRTLRHAAPD